MKIKTVARFFGAIAALAVLGLVMAYLAGVFVEKIDPRAAATRVSDKVAGQITEVVAEREPLIEQIAGTVRATNETIVSARITAAIVSVSVRAGDAVEAGDVLMTLDSRELESRLEAQRQTIAAAEAILGSVQPNADRIKKMFDRNLASQAELDRVQAELRAAQAELARVRRVADEAETALSYSVIRAPLTGRVMDRYADAGDTAVPGGPLLRLYDPNHLRLEANVRESLAGGLQLGDEVAVRIDALDREVPAAIEEIVPAADPGARSFLIKTSLPIQGALFPGMFGRLLLASGVEERFYIPERAITRVGQLEFVNIATDGAAVRRFVRSGRRMPMGRIEVLSGLAPGEQLIVPE